MYIKKIVTFVILIFFLPIMVYSQVVKGYITDRVGTPVNEAVISILYDSVVIATAISNRNGEFTIQQLKKNKTECGIFVSAMGYKSYSNDSIPFPTIISLDIYELNEVIVTAKRPQLTIRNGNVLVRMSGTSLEKYSNLQSSLQFIPNLIVSDKSLQVVGRGTPVIILDNKEVTSLQQVYSLDPSNIESVEIDNSPSSKYDSQYNAVLKITTKQNSLKKTGLSVYNNFILGRKYSNDFGVDVQSKLGIIESFINYRYKHTNILNYSTVEEFSKINNIYSDTISHNRNSHNLTLGLKYKMKDNMTVSFDYNFYNATNFPIHYNALVHTIYNIDPPKTLMTNIDKLGDFRQFNHVANLFYDYKIDSLSNLIFNSCYIKRPTSSIDKINQFGLINEFLFFENKSNSQSLMLNIDLTKSFHKGYIFYGGMRYSKIWYDNDMISKSNDDVIIKNTINNEQTVAVYMEAKKQFHNIHLQVGWRAEWNKNVYKYNQIDKKYNGHFYLSNFFPTIEMNFNIAPKLSIHGNYNSKIVRPRFEQLSPIITYLTPYSYNVGNPELKPTISHNIEFSGKIFSKINIGIKYMKNIDEIIYTAVNDVDTPDKLAYTSINISRANYFKYWLMYDNVFGLYELSSYAMLTTPYVKIPYKTEIITVNNPYVYIGLSNKFSIGKKIDLAVDFTYQSKTYSINTVSKALYSLSLVMNYSINRNLTLCFFANDLLFRNDPNERTRFGYVETNQNYNNDMQRIKFSLVYRLNRFKSSNNTNKYNNNDINRM